MGENLKNKEIDFVGQVVSGNVAGILIREKNIGKSIEKVQNKYGKNSEKLQNKHRKGMDEVQNKCGTSMEKVKNECGQSIERYGRNVEHVWKRFRKPWKTQRLASPPRPGSGKQWKSPGLVSHP